MLIDQGSMSRNRDLTVARNDRKLPKLAMALDDDQMSQTFGRLGLLGSRGGTAPIRHQVIKYTAGKRCVIEYSFDRPDNHVGTERLIGKLYRNNRGERIFQSLLNTWDSVASQKRPFRMARPLAYVPELGMIIQSFVPGHSLINLISVTDLANHVRAVARNLAHLHSLSVPGLRKMSMQDKLQKYCRPGPETLLATYPELRLWLKRINTALRSEELEDLPICPVHGDLGLAQIFIADDEAFFVDFDGLCRSHAAQDIGNFLVTLEVYLGQESRTLAEIFLESYLTIQPHDFTKGLKLYRAFAYLRRAMISFRTDANMVRRVTELLGAGVACLQSRRFDDLIDIHRNRNIHGRLS